MDQILRELEEEEIPEETLPTLHSERYLRTGTVTLDIEQRTAVVAGTDGRASASATLTHSEALLLACFMQHPGVVLSCDKLAKMALGYDVSMSTEETRNIVRPHIYRLRRKLEADSRKPSIIRNVHGRGYFFIA